MPFWILSTLAETSTDLFNADLHVNTARLGDSVLRPPIKDDGGPTIPLYWAPTISSDLCTGLIITPAQQSNPLCTLYCSEKPPSRSD